MNRYQELLDLIQTFQKDFEKFYVKGNKSAGTRVRKHMAASVSYTHLTLPTKRIV